MGLRKRKGCANSPPLLPWAASKGDRNWSGLGGEPLQPISGRQGGAEAPPWRSISSAAQIITHRQALVTEGAKKEKEEKKKRSTSSKESPK